MTPVETLTAAVALYEQRRRREPLWADPVVQAWQALLAFAAEFETDLGDDFMTDPETTHVERAVLASATAYLAGAA